MEIVNTIKSSLSNLLKDKLLVLGLTGGIAIYRVPDIARMLIRHGANIITFMTEKAKELLNPIIMEWATGSKVYTEISGYAEHVNICSKCDSLIIIPATYNTISKIANGISDNAVTLCASVVLGLEKPLIIIPTMNLSMWKSKVLQENLEKLKKLKNVYILEPLIEEDKAKIPSSEDIIDFIIDTLTPKDMIGLNVLITGGPTREYLDDVKYLTTPSSGLTGIMYAREAMARGANVTLIMGPTNLKPPPNVKYVQVTSVVEMYDIVINLVKKEKFDIIVLTAAPLDFTIPKKISGKISSDIEKLSIELIQAPKIAKDVKKYSPKSIVIGYKLEYNVSDDELIKRAIKRLEEGNWDLVLAHDASRGYAFKTLKDEVYLIDKFGKIEKIGPLHKRELARYVYNYVLSKFFS